MTTRLRLVALAMMAAIVPAFTDGAAHAERGGLLSAGIPTLGGGWVWSDEVWLHGWRIEKHAIIGHYRLVDANNLRHAFGSFETCLAKLNEVKAEEKFPALPKHLVIVMHGLGANGKFMQGLADYLADNGNLATANISYPSTMEDIDSYAASLDSLIRHLDGVESIDFVAHSMGNIVVRRYLNNLERLDPAMRPPVKFRRMVMIAPPNHGAELADRFADNKLVQVVAGKPLEQLAPSKGWPELESQLATPNFEFGIIVGGRGDGEGYLDAIPGDDDALLSIDTCKLAGASDFIQTKGIHQLMPKYREVREATLRFLTKGYFLSPESRTPVVARPR